MTDMDIVLASRNKKKIAELEALLRELCGDVRVLSLDDIGYEGDIEEDGKTFEENAIIKASVPAAMGYIGVADDSGLCVEALGGAPGVYSARYSEEGSDEANNQKLLSALEGADNRKAKFVCTVACVVPDKLGLASPADVAAGAFAADRAKTAVKAFTVRGECAGTITKAPDGDGGFGYDPLFLSHECGKTFACLTPEEKARVGHRGRAMRAFAEKLSLVK